MLVEAGQCDARLHQENSQETNAGGGGWVESEGVGVSLSELLPECQTPRARPCREL